MQKKKILSQNIYSYMQNWDTNIAILNVTAASACTSKIICYYNNLHRIIQAASSQPLGYFSTTTKHLSLCWQVCALNIPLVFSHLRYIYTVLQLVYFTRALRPALQKANPAHNFPELAKYPAHTFCHRKKNMCPNKCC